MPTDNTAALQALLNAGPVTLPANNTYYVTGLNVLYNFDLNGSTINYMPSTGFCLRVTAPGVTITNGMVIGPWDYTTPNNPSGNGGIASSYDDTVISVITVSQFSGYGINQTGNNPTCTHCTITKTGYVGYFFNSGASNTTGGEFSYNVIDRSMLSSSWATGITQGAALIRGSGGGAQIATAWNIHHNQFFMPSNPVDDTAECIEVRFLTNSNIYNNTFTGGSIGLSIVGNSTHCINYNNTYIGQNNEALEIGSSNNTSYNNTISNQIGLGILFDGTTSNNTLASTTIAGCGNHAIQIVAGVTNIAISTTTISIGANGKAGVYYHGSSTGMSITDSTIDGTGRTSTTGVFFDTSIGGFTMTRGNITNCSNMVTVYAGSVGTVTDNLTFNCVNRPADFVLGNISLNTHGALVTNLNFINTGCIYAPNISYTPSSRITILNQAMTPMLPANTGGAVVSYSISPSLPAGLDLNTTTGVISGTPTALSPATNYVVTATNSDGSANATVNITVNPLAPALSYSPGTAVFVLNQAISSISPSNTGGAPVSYSISPALPAGLAFNTSTGVISGTPTAIAPQTTYTITATNTAGSATTPLIITVNPVVPALSYMPATLIFVLGTPISNMSPSNTGGAPVSYSISPALPAGLAFNTSTGVICGTPTAILSTTIYTIKANNQAGTGQTVISLTVNVVAPNISYSPSTNNYTLAQAITPLSPSNSGGPSGNFSITPALPAGLIFNTATGMISGTPTVLSSQTTYTITATNITGSSNTTVNLAVKARVPAIGYAPATNIYTTNQPIPALAPVNNGGVIVSFAITPSLPAGLNFNTSNGVISGTPTGTSSVTTYTITATNTGGSAQAQVTLSVVAPSTATIKKKRFFFPANWKFHW
jgi:hypothetical protein